MLSKEQTFQIIDFVVKEAAGYDVKVTIQASAGGLTRFANSEIHQNVFEDKTDVQISITQGKKRSNITTNLYNEEGLKHAVQEAITNLGFLPEGQEQAPLVDEPPLMEAEIFDSELEKQYDVVGRAKLVKAGLDMLEDEYKAFGALSYNVMQISFGNSAGIKRFATGNSISFSAVISAEDGGSGYASETSAKAEGVDILAAFKRAYDKAKLNRNPIDIEPGAYTVILEPLAVGDLLTFMSYIGFSGKSVQNNMSFLTGKLGQKIFDERITIIDDYTHEDTVSLPFDLEGTPRQKVTIIENGVAKAVVHDMASAMKEGVKSTGHSVNMPNMGGIPLNLVFSNGEESLEDIIKNTKDGLLVTRFHYMNPVNPREAQLTALTRDGLFKIENGEIVAAVKNMRFTESILKAFNNIEAISKERHRTGFFIANYFVPGLKIRDFHFTGKASM